MLFYLVSHEAGVTKDALVLAEQTLLKSALGRAEYAADVLTVLKGDKLFPDMSAVLVGDSVALSIEIQNIPPYQGEPPVPEKNPYVKGAVTEIIGATSIRIDKALAMAPKADTTYRIERTVSHTDFDPADEAAFRAKYPTSSFLKAKLPWFIGTKYLLVTGGKIIDSRNGEEPYGIVYL
jgi:hypothetical protein